MDILEQLYYQNDINFDVVEDAIFDRFLNDFEKAIDSTLNFMNCYTSEIRFLNLKYGYIYNSKYCKLFFDILSKYDYNMRCELKDTIFELSHLKYPFFNKKSINKYLNSPVIQDISYNGRNKFTIYSDKFGKFSFKLASFYLKNNKEITKYIETRQIGNRCHQNTYFISNVMPDFYSITSLCFRYFEGYFHHSYTYNMDSNEIIDLCYNIIMDKDQYDKIFLPDEVSIIKNSLIQEQLNIVEEKSNQDYDRCELLKIALYKEYLRSINYDGDLESAPSVKQLILN